MVKIGKWILGLVVICMVFVFIGKIGNIEHHYTRKACIVVSVADGLVSVEDRTGNIWEYIVEGEPEPAIDSRVNLKMFTNYTNSIYDDVIEEVIEVK